jgi:hypothetical protein
MPIYRQGTGNKARVFAYTDELAGWLESGGNRAAAEPGAEEPAGAAATRPAARDRRRPILATCGIALAMALAVWLLWRWGALPAARVPHHWVLVEGSRLRILDSSERLCWERRFPPLSATFETETIDKTVIADIDRDGRSEVLFNFLPEDKAGKGGSLMCFEQDGRLRWEVHHGGPKTFGARSFDPNYVGRLVRPISAAGRPLVLSIANHHIWYPAQAALLDPKTGRVVDEYWHPGAIYYCVLRDIDRDGQDEVLLGAINNPGEGPGHAGLAVLKVPFSKSPRRIPEPADPFQPVTGGGELAYALFPHADVCRLAGQLAILNALQVDSYNRILVETPCSVVYYLDFNLKVQEYHFSGDFAGVHERNYRQGLLNHRLGPEETAELGSVALFPAAPDGNSPLLKRFWKY